MNKNRSRLAAIMRDVIFVCVRLMMLVTIPIVTAGELGRAGVPTVKERPGGRIMRADVQSTESQLVNPSISDRGARAI